MYYLRTQNAGKTDKCTIAVTIGRQKNLDYYAGKNSEWLLDFSVLFAFRDFGISG